MPRALITGGSAGLGRALAAYLIDQGWEVIVTGRDADCLAEAVSQLGAGVMGVVGDIADDDHRAELAAVAERLDVLVNNASTLGVSPLVPVQQLSAEQLRRLWEVNVVAPIDLVRRLRSHFTDQSAVVSVTSDAAAEHYETWGGYAATKVALEHLTLTMAAEDPAVRWWAIDPGDMRTQMHQDAFPGEDISDRPLPESVAPALGRMIRERPPSGRYRASDFAHAEQGV